MSKITKEKWNIINKTAEYIFEDIEAFSLSGKESNSTIKFKLRNKSEIYFNLHYKNIEDASADVTMYDGKNKTKSYHINISLPCLFLKKRKNSSISKRFVNDFLKTENNKEFVKINLIRTIAHEITHCFDKLFHNKKYMENYEKSVGKLQSPEEMKAYFESKLEKNAFFSEIESHAIYLKNNNKTKESSIKELESFNYETNKQKKFIMKNEEYSKEYKEKIKSCVEEIFS